MDAGELSRAASAVDGQPAPPPTGQRAAPIRPSRPARRSRARRGPAHDRQARQGSRTLRTRRARRGRRSRRTRRAHRPRRHRVLVRRRSSRGPGGRGRACRASRRRDARSPAGAFGWEARLLGDAARCRVACRVLDLQAVEAGREGPASDCSDRACAHAAAARGRCGPVREDARAVARGSDLHGDAADHAELRIVDGPGGARPGGPGVAPGMHQVEGLVVGVEAAGVPALRRGVGVRGTDRRGVAVPPCAQHEAVGGEVGERRTGQGIGIQGRWVEQRHGHLEGSGEQGRTSDSRPATADVRQRTGDNGLATADERRRTNRDGRTEVDEHGRASGAGWQGQGQESV